jgi:hypothetical protein
VADTGNDPSPDALRQRLNSEADTCVRAVVKVVNGGFPWVEYFEAVIGAQPDGWASANWDYGAVLFLAVQCRAKDLLPLTTSPDNPIQTIQLANLQLLVRPIQRGMQWSHKPSRAQYDVPMAPWPTFDYEVSPTIRNASYDPTDGGFLIGDGPPFPMFSNAYRAFFTANFASVGASNPSRYGLFRFAQTDAWIERVRVTTTHLEITVAGYDKTGVVAELNAPTNRVSKPVAKSGRIRLRLQQPLGNDAWLYLTRDGHWLDYRAINMSYIAPDVQAMQGIEIATEPTAALEALISGGEGEQLEFKYRLPADDKEKFRMLCTVAAFANTNGGTLVFGVDRDEMTIVGLSITDFPTERDRLINIIKSGLTESPRLDGPIEQTLDGHQLMLLAVHPSSAVPYGVTLQQQRGEHPKYYVRSGANNFPATPADIRVAVRARTRTTDSSFASIYR